jgi:predicted N-acetyltransferase YhbS
VQGGVVQKNALVGNHWETKTMHFSLRSETPQDFRAVEEVTREAFWNLFVPGCDEHFLAHVMRTHPDFIAPLDFVAESDGEVVGNIMYCRSHVVDIQDSSHSLATITFGPISVLPTHQKKGIGSALIRHSLEKARQLGFQAVIIQGHPHNYCKHGFRSAKDFAIADSEGNYPYSLLVLPLHEDYFRGYQWRYIPSAVYSLDQSASAAFDAHFEHKEKKYQFTQEEFSIACRAYLT